MCEVSFSVSQPLQAMTNILPNCVPKHSLNPEHIDPYEIFRISPTGSYIV